jgi:hypothetical protein
MFENSKPQNPKTLNPNGTVEMASKKFLRWILFEALFDSVPASPVSLVTIESDS